MTSHLPFHEQLRYERKKRGWSQADLAEKVGCDTKSIGRWENGESLPRPYHRQVLCELLGKNPEELGLIEEIPLSPSQQAALAARPAPMESQAYAQDSSTFWREDWGEAPYIESLYGRYEECDTLARWVEQGNCRVGVILGMGGVGKTAIAAVVATRVKQTFSYLFWRSLQDVPPFEYFLKQCISFFSDQHHFDLPEAVDDQISLLINHLRNHRCLLVLDNFESVLQEGQSAGRYRDGYAPYGRLLQRVGAARHQSCLLITSREKPKEIAHLEGKNAPVRTFSLSGLSMEAGQQLLQDKELLGSQADWLTLVRHYSGNPLALQLVAESIQEVFAGEIAGFLQRATIAFGDINDLLAQQFYRLSAQEQEIMYWLAVEREAVSLETVSENLVYPMPAGTQLEVFDSLRRRSLIEKRGPSQFTLQPVIMEYVTTDLVRRAESEFETEALEDVWTRYAFSKAQAKGYVRESQQRLLLAPLAESLLTRLGKDGIKQSAQAILLKQRQAQIRRPGYLAGNLLNLLNYVACDLRGFDFSHLVIRQAYVQGVVLPEVNFAHAHFLTSVFTNTFGNILAVAYSPQGNLLAVGMATGEIWLYDVPGYVLRSICYGHTDGVWSLAFSPDGTLLASSSDDYTIRVWDSSSGHCLRTLQKHTSRVRAIAFNSDGKLLASGSDDQTIRLWNVHTGECLTALRDHTSRVWSVAFQPSGNLLASGSTDQTVRLWDLDTKSCLLTLHGHSGWVRSVAFHPQDNILASGSDDQTIRLWDITTGRCLKTLHGHSNRVWSVAFSPDGSILASGSEDATISLWDPSTGERSRLLHGHSQGIRSISFIPGGQTLVSGGDDQTIRVWDSATGYCLQMVQGYTNRVLSLAFSPDGKAIVSGSEDAAIRVWDVETGQCLKTLQDRSHGVLAVAFAPDGSKLASGGQDQTVRLWDLAAGRRPEILRGHTNWVRTVAFSPDGHMLASGSEDATIRLWSVTTGSCFSTLQGHSSWVRSVAFSPDGKLLASGADDQTVRLWEARTGFCLRMLQGHTSRVRAITFSPDGETLASGGEDQTVRLWDVRTGKCLHLLQGHSGWVRSVAFSPAGKLLASGSEDQTIRLWDSDTSQCLATLHGHANRVRAVTFNFDGTLLASSSDDGTIKLWDMQTRECLQTLISERPYERMNIAHVQGLTEAQKTSLRSLGAIERD